MYLTLKESRLRFKSSSVIFLFMIASFDFSRFFPILVVFAWVILKNCSLHVSVRLKFGYSYIQIKSQLLKNWYPLYPQTLFQCTEWRFCTLKLTSNYNFHTWPRVIKTSILDHINVKDTTCITNLSSILPPFGHQILSLFEIKSS